MPKEEKRLSIHNYFMDIAVTVSRRATCDRKHVGCILVKDKRIIATGYNGSMTRARHCDEIGHLMEDGHCVRTVHAEINALAQCAKYGVSCDNSYAYCNTFPCWDCFKALVNAGVKCIYYKDSYAAKAKDNVIRFSKELNIPVVKIT